jgi:hypothetical protein
MAPQREFGTQARTDRDDARRRRLALCGRQLDPAGFVALVNVDLAPLQR